MKAKNAFTDAFEKLMFSSKDAFEGQFKVETYVYMQEGHFEYTELRGQNFSARPKSQNTTPPTHK